jgi:hypothetical protein
MMPSDQACVLDMQVTSVLGDMVSDTIQSTAGGNGSVQFPDRTAVSPPVMSAGGRRLLHP